MPETQRIDVRQLVDEQRIGIFNITIVVVSTLLMTCDGYDIFAAAFVAPELVKEWHVAPSALGPFLTASVVGLLFGAPLLGYFGDRFGRKKAIIIGTLFYGGFTLLATPATSLHQLMVLRFVAGLGIGGVIPNVIALNAEFAPKRLRAAFIIITQFGIPAGQALGGMVSGLWVPAHGWRVVFFLGGVVPLLLTLVAYFLLPESIKYLVLQASRVAEVRRIATILRPELPHPEDAQFVIPSSAVTTGISPLKLFSAGLASMTALLWLVQIALQVANFFMISWLPLLLRSAGATRSHTAVSTSLYSIGGMIGGTLMLFLVDRFGAIPIVAMFALGVPVVVRLGVPGLPTVVVLGAAAGAGFCIISINFGMNAVMGMIYPTAIRSNGVGWTMAVGRIGSLSGSVLGGLLLGMHLSQRQLFLAPAIFLGIGAVLCALFLRLCIRRFRGYRLDEAPVREGVIVSSQIKPRAVP
jgi:AAHS family 4-hydroxybenzoate transporter-like MFS transporter